MTNQTSGMTFEKLAEWHGKLIHTIIANTPSGGETPSMIGTTLASFAAQVELAADRLERFWPEESKELAAAHRHLVKALGTADPTKHAVLLRNAARRLDRVDITEFF